VGSAPSPSQSEATPSPERAATDAVGSKKRNTNDRGEPISDNRSCQVNVLNAAQIQHVTQILEEVHGVQFCATTAQRRNGFFTFLGEFRDVKVEVMVVDHPDPEPASNVAFREIQARRGQPTGGASATIFREQLRVNENQPYLDLITMTLPADIRGTPATAHVIIQEVHPGQRPAAELFDELAEHCKRMPFSPPVPQLIALAHGLFKLVGLVHRDGMAYGADPRSFCLLSDMKDGHGKKAATRVIDIEGNPVVLLLGDATHVLQDGFEYQEKARTCQSAQTEEQQRTKRAKNSVTAVGGSRPQRTSLRLAETKSIMTWLEIEQVWKKNSSNGMQRCDVGSAQSADIGRICGSIIHILTGNTGDNNNTFWQSDEQNKTPLHLQLLQYCLERNPGVEECPVDLGPVFERLDSKHQLLIRFLAETRGMTADTALDHILLKEFQQPKNEYAQGLDSAPESARKSLLLCAPLMKAINEKTLHYFVEGGRMWWKGKEKKKLSTWLVYSWIDDSKGQRWVRGLYTAEKGKAGDIAAIYRNRIVSDLEMNLIIVTHVLLFPSNRGTQHVGFDGTPRGIGCEQKAIDSWTLGSLINSVRDETSRSAEPWNCSREWHPEWRSLSTDKSVANPLPPSTSMGLILSKDVNPYTQLLYAYNWRKEEDKSLNKLPQDKSNTNNLAQLARESGRKTEEADRRKGQRSLRR
jgi:hypothetical protein